MSEQNGRGKAPATVEQVAAAMAALGLYSGENTSAEHAEEAARLGGPDAYRVRVVNARPRPARRFSTRSTTPACC